MSRIVLSFALTLHSALVCTRRTKGVFTYFKIVEMFYAAHPSDAIVFFVSVTNVLEWPFSSAPGVHSN